VRNDEARTADDKIAIEQNVEVQRAGAVGNCIGAIAAEVPLDKKQRAEQLDGCETGFECGGGVEEARLIGKSDWLSGVERGTGGQTPQGFETRGGTGQGGLRGAGRTGQVRAHSDVGRAHTASGYREAPAIGWNESGETKGIW